MWARISVTAVTLGEISMNNPRNTLGEFIASRGTERTLERGQLLFCEGDESTVVYACVKGRVNLFITSPGGREVIVGAKIPIQGFGELSCIDGAPRSAGAMAMESTVISTLPGPAFLEALEQAPEISLLVLKELSIHLRRLNARLSARISEGTVERVGHQLVDLAAKFKRHGLPDTQLVLSVTQDELASWVGCTREAAARALGDLRDAGLVSTSRGKITILDPDGLSRYLNAVRAAST